MMRSALVLFLLATPAMAETVVATRTIRPLTVLGPQDVTLVADDTPGALTDPGDAIGREAHVALYVGRPIRPSDIGAPALIDRNQIVPLSYMAGALEIRAEGRALARGGAGEVIRVMNLSSRTTVFGRIAEDGTVRVGPGS